MDQQENLNFSISDSDSVFGSKPAAVIETPQNVRTMGDVFSPGEFFKSRSGVLGDLEDRNVDRVGLYKAVNNYYILLHYHRYYLIHV